MPFDSFCSGFFRDFSNSFFLGGGGGGAWGGGVRSVGISFTENGVSGLKYFLSLSYKFMLVDDRTHFVS